MSEIKKKFQPLFVPNSVALIGASNSPNKWGCIVLANLINGGFDGKIYPINPKEDEVLGLRAYRSVSDLPQCPDLAVFVIPPSAVPSEIDKCVAMGVRAGLIITAGFAEVGADGARLQKEMVDKAKRGGMIFVGPNCNGILRPSNKLFAEMPPLFPKKGPISVVAQSGNVLASLGRRGIKKGYGFSCLVSSGNEACLHSEDFFEYMGDDSETKVILSYIEGFKNGRRFFEVAQEVTKKKPIVVLKSGGSSAGAKAAMSHTASLAVSDTTFDGVCTQAGIIRAFTIDDLFNIGVGFLNQPLPRDRRVGILTGGGGWGVLAADACIKHGLEVVDLTPKTLSKLDAILPPWWNRGNPVDLVAGNVDGALIKSLEILLQSPEIDGVILLGIVPALKLERVKPLDDPAVLEEYFPRLLNMISDLFDQLMHMAKSYEKPVVVATELPFIVGGVEQRMTQMLGEKGYACYFEPEIAVTVMASLMNYAQYLRKTGHEI